MLLPFDEAADAVDEPAHVVRFGSQVHVKGIPWAGSCGIRV